MRCKISFAEKCPELIKEWHSKNELKPNQVCPSSNARVMWICKNKHEWEVSVRSRFGGNGCPYCSNKKVCTDNCLVTVNPELAKEWHSTKNGDLTPFLVGFSSGTKVWWRCKKEHSYQATVSNRSSRGRGCPYCCGRYALRETSLALQNPKLVKEWDVIRNEPLTPFDVKKTSHTKVWWTCDVGHKWKALVSNRSNGRGCPYCAGQKICDDNCLATINPKLSKEWHPTKNGELTPNDVMPSSGKKRWWKCAKGHEWEIAPNTRTNGNGCPHCIVFKTELKCRTIFESIFKMSFPKARPFGSRLELDGYCKELQLAFEYNGKQHYEFVKHWQKTYANFERQQERDIRKAQLCEEKGIKLVVIPYTENKRLEEFIQERV